jgi:hypothetical protein
MVQAIVPVLLPVEEFWLALYQAHQCVTGTLLATMACTQQIPLHDRQMKA